jgi:hypothetical protein
VKPVIIRIVLILIVAGAWLLRPDGPILGLPPMRDSSPAESIPRQELLAGDQRIALRGGEAEARLLAAYQLDARVLRIKRYRFGAEGRYSRIDAALAWGPLARPENAAALRVSQRNRFYRWQVSAADWPRLEPLAPARHTANVHLLTEDPAISSLLKRMRPGSGVRLQGYLIEIHQPDGWRWTSSLTREDAGNGACELFLVTAAAALP